MHKKNPYKPWWCNSCIEKYCVSCNKTFSENHESICCDYCSYWHHFHCSGLNESDFKNLSKNSISRWKCQSCTQKLCVSCNLSTHNKSKSKCCSCGNLYHNVCAGIPKSKTQDKNWFCLSCRSNILPFHYVDYKNLIKMSTSLNKFSLESISLKSLDMSRKCSICDKMLSKANQGIPCRSCKSKIHVKCSKLRDPKNSFHTFKGNWQCENCMKDKFPFYELDDNSLSDLLEDPSSNKKDISKEFSIDEKLKLLLSQSSKSNWYAHTSNIEDDPGEGHVFKHDMKPNFHYYDINDFRKTRQTWNQHNTLSLFHTNISSLQANVGKMEDLLTDLSWNFDIIALSETWNDEKNKSNFTAPIIDGYHTYSGTTGSSQKGGCGLYVSENLSPTPRTDLEFKIEDKNSETESHWIELNSESGPNTIIGVIYRHPSGKSDKFIANLQTTLKKIKKENKKTVICGDFNQNLLNFDVDKNVNCFLCTMLDYSFQPCITEPTRITNSNKPSLVDNIFTNTFDNPVSGNILEQISYDHLPNFVILDDIKNKKASPTFKRDKRNINTEKFQSDLLGDDLLVKLLNATDTDAAYGMFLKKYCEVLDQHAPLKKLSKKERKREQKPWITLGLTKSISKKRSLFKQLKKLKLKNKNTDEVHKKYKYYNDTINKLKIKCKRDYYQNYFNNNASNSKKIWNGINRLLNRGRKKQGTIFLEENGLISDPLKVANKFNDYYLNIADKLCEKIPKRNNKFQDYLKNPTKNKLTLKETTPDEIAKIITDLDGKKSSDIYNISPDVVKLNTQAISQILTIIFNISIHEGCFPTAMKAAKITPIHKGDSVLSVGNYRPISLLPIFSKIFERLIYNRLIVFITENKILSKLQFGFQKNKSTEQAVTSIVSALDQAKQEKKSSYCVFLDFAKAFDTVNHEILLSKLSHYGIQGSSQSLLKTYLSNRTQQTEINGVLSDKGIIKHGVPQGSVLGPLLFLLYINDISESSNILKFFLFADDTTVFYSDQTNDDTENILNRELSKVSDWLAANKLSLNVKKSNFLHFHHLKCKKQTINLKLNDIKVDEKAVTKYLGVLIDNKLNWKSHIEHVKTKLSRGNGMISRIRYYVNEKCLLNLYYSFIYSHINYNLLNWTSTSPSLINSINLKVKQSVRLISFKNKYEHTNPLFLTLKILPFNDMIKYKQGSFLWKISNGYICSPLSEIFTKNLRNPLRFNIPNPTCTQDKHKIVYSSTKYWNSLPVGMRKSSTINSFNEKHKKHLLGLLTKN